MEPHSNQSVRMALALTMLYQGERAPSTLITKTEIHMVFLPVETTPALRY